MKRTVNKDNPKNIYCDHCKHWNRGTCKCTKSKYYQNYRDYYHRCKCFEWRDDI